MANKEYQQYQERINPEVLQKWLAPYIGHEHLMDIKEAPSVEKYLAVAPDIYVMAAMLRSMLSVAAEQKSFGEYGIEEAPKVQPWSELTEEEKISQKEVRNAYMAGLRAGRDRAMIEMANRITHAARENLDRFRLENPEYDPALVIDEPADSEVE
jgi:hypothetical protein